MTSPTGAAAKKPALLAARGSVDARQPPALQDDCWDRLRLQGAVVSIYLLNGIRLQGVVLASDTYTVLLANGEQRQLLYKRVISAVIPIPPV